MNVIITGDKTFNNYKLLKYKSLEILKGLNPTEITIYHTNGEGAPELAEHFAKERNFKRKEFTIDWANLHAPGAVIKEGRYGKRYNALAAFDTDSRMIDSADMLIVFYPALNKSIPYIAEAARGRRIPYYAITF
jgi:hypothetical protein